MELIIWIALLIIALIGIILTLYAYNTSAYLAIFLFIISGALLLFAGLSGLYGYDIEDGKNTTIHYNGTLADFTNSTTNWRNINNTYTTGLNLTLILTSLGWMIFGLINLLRQRGQTEMN